MADHPSGGPGPGQGGRPGPRTSGPDPDRGVAPVLDLDDRPVERLAGHAARERRVAVGGHATVGTGQLRRVVGSTVPLRPESAWFLSTSLPAIEERSPCEDEPARDGYAGQDRGNGVTEQYGGPYGTCEGGEIRHDVVDGGDESLVHDMGDSDDDTAREGHGQEEGHHRKQSGRIPAAPSAVDGATDGISFIRYPPGGAPMSATNLCDRRPNGRSCTPCRSDADGGDVGTSRHVLGRAQSDCRHLDLLCMHLVYQG